jgi:hypothetical protein
MSVVLFMQAALGEFEAFFMKNELNRHDPRISEV